MENNVSITGNVNLHFRILILEIIKNQANSKMGLGQYVMIEVDFHRNLLNEKFRNNSTLNIRETK
jgi:hypothetical protein